MKKVLLICFGIIAFKVIAQSNTIVRSSFPNIPIKIILDSLHYDTNLIQIKISKSNYHLQVFFEDKLIKTYPCVFGFGYPIEKLQKGDGGTPEGRFLVNAFYPDPAWDMIISLNYPNKQSMVRIANAKKAGKISKYATSGGSICIHGTYDEGNSIDIKSNWTNGCISIKNSDINDLCTILKIYGNVVFIEP